MNAQKRLPIGIENFEKMQLEDFYFIDKTALIKELLSNWAEVNLFTRPRRFGKSLNMSMLKSFFEIGCNPTLFDGLEIKKDNILCEKYMGQFPVISITLKGVNGTTFDGAYRNLRTIIGNEAMRFQFLLDSDRLTEREKNQYRQLVHIDETGNTSFIMPAEILEHSLLTLSKLLKKHYDRNVIILIDEYDVPLDKANQFGYYNEMIHLIRNLFHQALKTNDSLQFAILTGCLRVSKESIFTGLNNLNVLSITSAGFNEYFGFTDNEVKEMLHYYDLMDYYDSIQQWYDGYLSGNVHIYCPWDVISYCGELLRLRKRQPNAYMAPKNYWMNTSGNSIVRSLLKKANGQTKAEMEALIAGEVLEKNIKEELTYLDFDQVTENIWSILFATGYLTYTGITEQGWYQVKIPNLEIRTIFTEQVMKWFHELTKAEPFQLDIFCNAVLRGDVDTFQKSFTAYLKKTISIRDTFVPNAKKENFYHGILLGLLSHREEWSIKSNIESGDGFSDILITDEEEEIGIVIEVKYGEDEKLDQGCSQALKQIETNHYAERLINDGMTTIFKYGVACYKKRCKIVLGK